ncbi:UNVERIFIED_CONTAM: hypothetical protein PYX00_011523 [Menopon gallinae]|uniref:Ribulose-phosphate 3-epimerase n=1 Tax=Menopon gallinae TaxID=328185 RepID=A0AAW2H7S9_9NEOP
MGEKQIGVSILNSSILDLDNEMALVRRSGIRHVHIDIMDTSFTENVSFGPSVANRILERYDFVFDIHLMVRHPLPILKLLDLARVDTVFVHAEIDDARSALRWCADRGTGAGVAINPETPLDTARALAPGTVLVMCVKPGFGGQAFKEECVARVRSLKQDGLAVGVDGGINAETIGLVSDADYFVVGTAFFGSENKEAFVQSLYKKVRTVLRQGEMAAVLMCCLLALAAAHIHDTEYGGRGDIHDAGTGMHRGDTGKSNIMFAQDVVHHGDGGLYIGRGGAAGADHPFGVDDIHNQMNKAKLDKYAASIAQKQAALAATKLKGDIAAEVARKKDEELAILATLDAKAQALEKEKPEVLGKKVIPVVNFTEESNPLKHHVRMLNAKIAAINETERKNIEAQRQLTRLDDITDKFKFNNMMVENPKLYSRFLAAGAIQDYMLDVPVADTNGMFYIKPYSGSGSHAGLGHLRDRKEYLDEHTHFQDHGIHVPEKDYPIARYILNSRNFPLRY